MKNLKDSILEKLKITTNSNIETPYLKSNNKVCCLLKEYLGWVFGINPDEISQSDFEDFEMLDDNIIKQHFNSYRDFFKWFKDNKDSLVTVNCTTKTNGYFQSCEINGILINFYTGDDFRNIVNQ